MTGTSPRDEKIAVSYTRVEVCVSTLARKKESLPVSFGGTEEVSRLYKAEGKRANESRKNTPGESGGRVPRSRDKEGTLPVPQRGVLRGDKT